MPNGLEVRWCREGYCRQFSITLRMAMCNTRGGDATIAVGRQSVLRAKLCAVNARNTFAG